MNAVYQVRQYSRGNWGYIINWGSRYVPIANHESKDGFSTKAAAKEAAARRIIDASWSFQREV